MFDHVGITVSDLAASRAFYREALGLPDVEGEFVEWATSESWPWTTSTRSAATCTSASAWRIATPTDADDGLEAAPDLYVGQMRLQQLRGARVISAVHGAVSPAEQASCEPHRGVCFPFVPAR